MQWDGCHGGGPQTEGEVILNISPLPQLLSHAAPGNICPSGEAFGENFVLQQDWGPGEVLLHSWKSCPSAEITTGCRPVCSVN